MGSFSCIIWKGGCKYGVAFVLWNKTTENKKIALFCRNCLPCSKCLLIIGKSIIALLFPLAWVGSIEYFHQSIPPALKQIVSALLSCLFSINDHRSAWEWQKVIILSHSWDHYLSFSRADNKEMIPFFTKIYFFTKIIFLSKLLQESKFVDSVFSFFIFFMNRHTHTHILVHWVIYREIHAAFPGNKLLI